MPANHIKNNELRRKAVQMRLDGKPLKAITSVLGLSAPTIISAHKAYLASGWSAVDAKPRGRQHGDSSIPEAEQDRLKSTLRDTLPERFNSDEQLWRYGLARQWLQQQDYSLSERAALGYFQRWGLDADFPPTSLPTSGSSSEKRWLESDYPRVLREAKSRSSTVLWGGFLVDSGNGLFFTHSLRKSFQWLQTGSNPTAPQCVDFFKRVQKQADGHVTLLLRGLDIARVKGIQQWLSQQSDSLTLLLPDSARSSDSRNLQQYIDPTRENQLNSQELPMPNQTAASTAETPAAAETGLQKLSHLQRLESESIHIMREVIAEADNPVMLYSGGKDSTVMLHVALKAFYPAPLPFPLLHIDTGWKFRAMIDYRDSATQTHGLEMLNYTSVEGLEQGVNPFTHGAAIHTEIMKTEALKHALDKHRFDVAFGGARRDEEKSRAKERIFSFRSSQHRWDPKDQRPECWHLYNTRKNPDESIRAFPLANWTELDIWQYIHQQDIPVVPLYFAAERPVVERDGMLIVVDDERMPLHADEVPTLRQVRFRSLGCYPLTGAIESHASNTTEIIRELLCSRTSERQGRMIDHDAAASMEKKKQEGYF